MEGVNGISHQQYFVVNGLAYRSREWQIAMNYEKLRKIFGSDS